MTIRYLALGGGAAIALGALALDASSAATTASTTQMAPAPVRATTPVSKVNNPMAVLAKLPVQTAQGVLIGSVETVVTGSDGHALVLTVTDKSHKVVGIQADKLGFDATRRVLVANRTPAEVKALPRMS
jgi:hypothetical protein